MCIRDRHSAVEIAQQSSQSLEIASRAGAIIETIVPEIRLTTDNINQAIHELNAILKENAESTVQISQATQAIAQPVSYTHLDVYKRQVITHGESVIFITDF